MHRFATLTFLIARQAKRLARDESGTTAIEYAVIATGIAVVIVAAVHSLGTATNAMYTSVETALK